jgi:hypothetical protein
MSVHGDSVKFFDCSATGEIKYIHSQTSQLLVAVISINISCVLDCVHFYIFGTQWECHILKL